MNKCLNCKESVKNKYCNVSCQNKHQGSVRSNKRYGEFKDFEVECAKCTNMFTVNERENLYPQKKKYHCSRACANSRTHTQETKNNISSKLTKSNIVTLTCMCCNKSFERPFNKRHQKTCSRSCSMKVRNKTEGLASKGGRASVQSQGDTRRSKNEMHFAKLCEDYFDNVLTNEPIFNGWDADVIIEDLKIAVLWNGKWHYEKITESHSVEQVQNRDRIKISEIKKGGYTPYVIKDMGKEDKSFVNEKFLEFIKNQGI